MEVDGVLHHMEKKKGNVQIKIGIWDRRPIISTWFDRPRIGLIF